MSAEVDVREASQILGIGETTVRSWIASGRITPIGRQGVAWRLDRQQIEALAAAKTPPLTAHESMVQRFWARVEKTDGCWLWTGRRNANGYGGLNVGSRADGTRTHRLAHRISYELAHGAIPDGLLVCHRCDTPACVNPAHLFVGTQTDNMRDCQAKGRLRAPWSKTARGAARVS